MEKYAVVNSAKEKAAAENALKEVKKAQGKKKKEKLNGKESG